MKTKSNLVNRSKCSLHHVLLLTTALVSAPAVSGVSAERLTNHENEPGSWLSYGRDYSEQRFSPLEQINKNNVPELGLDWSYKFESKRGLEATPLMVDGTIYLTGAWSRVYAFDAESGKLKWTL